MNCGELKLTTLCENTAVSEGVRPDRTVRWIVHPSRNILNASTRRVACNIRYDGSIGLAIGLPNLDHPHGLPYLESLVCLDEVSKVCVPAGYAFREPNRFVAQNRS